MRVLRPISEDEMVAVFLRGELTSERFEPGIRNALAHLGCSGGTRRPSDAALRILAGLEAYGVPNDGFHELAMELRGGRRWSPLIVVSARQTGGDILLDGHGRLPGMALSVIASAMSDSA